MLTLERAKQLLDCNLSIGKLTWLDNYQRPDLIGQQAGYLSDEYWKVSIDGEVYYVCKIVWLFAYGYIPTQTVDHADTNKSNDSITNLRLATKGQNAANSKMNIRNTSGYKGVSFCKATQRWRANIQIDGVVRNLGRYDTPQEAHQAWVNAAVAAYGEEFVRVA